MKIFIMNKLIKKKKNPLLTIEDSEHFAIIQFDFVHES